MKPTGASTKKKGKARAKPRPAAGDASEAPRTGAASEAASSAGSSTEGSSESSEGSSRESSRGSSTAQTSASAPAKVAGVVPERDTHLEERRAAQAGLLGLGLVLVGAVVGGVVIGPSLAVLVLMGGAFVACIAFFWSSLRTLLGETPLSGADAYAIGAPRAEEEQKRAVLRALKDLEFERSVGKISEDDYRKLVTHYRGEAKRLLRLLDEEAQPMRDRAEVLISARLHAAGLAPKQASVFREAGKKRGEREREAAAEEASRELREAVTTEPDEDTSEEPSETADTADTADTAETSASEADAETAATRADRDDEPEKDMSAQEKTGD